MGIDLELPSRIGLRSAAMVALMVALTAIPGVAAPVAPGAPATRVVPRLYDGRPSIAELSAIGRLAFGDPTLSADGRLACSTCHDPHAAFGPGAHAPSPFADGHPEHQGHRAIPSLRYVQFIPRFAEHFVDDEGDDEHGVDEGPLGGLTWDGRRDSAREQARIPLFAPEEMANTNDAALAARVAKTAWAAGFRTAFSAPGGDVFADSKTAVDWLALAFEVYQQAPEFAPFTSRWDRVLAGTAMLTPTEKRGYALYQDPAKGNCETCHPSARMARGAAPLFTDAGFVAIAVPRAAGLPAPAASADAMTLKQVAALAAAQVQAEAHGHIAGPVAVPSRAASRAGSGVALDTTYDLGLCASGRAGLTSDPSYCGRFRTPSLRNVAVRPTFFHNGALHSLRDAVAFYATRDTDPARWYSKNPDGTLRLYDDLPAALVPYIDHEIPFPPRPDGKPRLDDADIDDIVAFLRTLTDADVEGAEAAK